MFPIASAWVCIATAMQTAPPTTPKQAVSLAFRHRLALVAAEARTDRARASARALSSTPAPRLDLQTASNRELRGNDDDLILAQSIDLFGRRAARRRVGAAQVQVAGVEFRKTALQVQQEVLTSYGEACAAQERVRISNAQLNLLEKIRVATQKRADAGITPPVQVERATLEVETARQANQALQTSSQAAMIRLMGALGTTGEPPTPVDFADLGDSQPDLETVANQRPDVLELRASQSLVRAEMGQVRSESRPEFEVSLRTSPWTYSDNQTGVRATLSIPLGNRQVRDESAALNAQARAGAASMEDLRHSIQSELAALRTELAAARRQLDGAQKLGERARQLVRASELGFAEGATSLLEVLESTRSLREIEEGILAARLRLFQVQSDLLTASGTLLTGVER